MKVWIVTECPAEGWENDGIMVDNYILVFGVPYASLEGAKKACEEHAMLDWEDVVEDKPFPGLHWEEAEMPGWITCEEPACEGTILIREMEVRR